MYQNIGKKVAGSAGNVIWDITCNIKKSRIYTYLNIYELDRFKIRK
jgi:hypothetical protein